MAGASEWRGPVAAGGELPRGSQQKRPQFCPQMQPKLGERESEGMKLYSLLAMNFSGTTP